MTEMGWQCVGLVYLKPPHQTRAGATLSASAHGPLPPLSHLAIAKSPVKCGCQKFVVPKSKYYNV